MKSARMTLGQRIHRCRELYFLLALPVLWYVVFHYFPMYGVQIAFRDYYPSRGFFGSPWVGLEHFRRFFSSYYFGRVLTNTLSINFYALLVAFPIPIVFALMLNEIKQPRYRKTIQIITYLPNFLSAVVIVSILQLLLNPSNGVVNILLLALGRAEAVNFFAEPRIFQHLYVWSGVWERMGWEAIIYVAALAGIDPSLYEAATIDGATRLQRIRFITIPGIVATIVTLLLLRTGAIMNIGYEKILLMQNALNMETSDVISTFVYRSGILDTDYSFSAAVGLFNSVSNFILLVVTNTIAKRTLQTSLW
jgi:putative aldouronate transport system permease protein